MGPNALVGNWRLVSLQVVVNGEPKDLFGSRPNGYLILTREGRSMVITTAEGRTAGENEVEREFG